MRFRLHPLLILLALGGVVPFPRPAAAVSMAEKTAARHQANAVRAVAAQRWEPARREIGKARSLLQKAELDEWMADKKKRENPQYRAGLRALQQWALEQKRKAPYADLDMKKLAREATVKRAALDRKFGFPTTAQLAAQRKRRAAEQSERDLQRAALDDLEAACLAGTGKPGPAEALRARAGMLRLTVYQALHKAPQAEQAAQKLLALKAPTPEVFAVVGTFYQSQKQFERAVEVWKRGIASLEGQQAKPPAPATTVEARRSHSRRLGEFYRQLAFSYQRLGNGTEMNRALQKAGEVEARAASTGRR